MSDPYDFKNLFQLQRKVVYRFKGHSSWYIHTVVWLKQYITLHFTCNYLLLEHKREKQKGLFLLKSMSSQISFYSQIRVPANTNRNNGLFFSHIVVNTMEWYVTVIQVRNLAIYKTSSNLPFFYIWNCLYHIRNIAAFSNSLVCLSF